MKSTIQSTILLALPLVAQAFSFGSHRHIRRDFGHKDLASHFKRKTPIGTGDATTEPSNLASGSFGADKNCTCWHTVIDGEVCLGLIDKSNSWFDIDMFFKYNPQVNSDCSNLETGQAYCVDNGPNDGDAATTTAKAKHTSQVAKVAVKTTTHKAAAATATSTASASDDDCDDDDDEDDDDEEDCEEEEDTPTTTFKPKAAAVKIKATSSSSDDDDDAWSSSDWSAPSSSSDYDAPASSSKASSSSSYSGIATYYYQGGVAGACGTVHTDDTYIVALQTSMYNEGAHCGSKIKLTNTDTGASVTATVADECPTCGSSTDVDCSVAVFDILSNYDLGAGVANIDWDFA